MNSLATAAFLSVVLNTEMLDICIQTSYNQNVQLILKSYLPVVYGTTLSDQLFPTVSGMIHHRRDNSDVCLFFDVLSWYLYSLFL